jgi:hypothetical protein
MLSVFMLSVTNNTIMLSVIMLNVVMLNVVAPTVGLNHKSLRTSNLQEMETICSKLASSQMSITNTPAWTNTLAY